MERQTPYGDEHDTLPKLVTVDERQLLKEVLLAGIVAALPFLAFYACGEWLVPEMLEHQKAAREQMNYTADDLPRPGVTYRRDTIGQWEPVDPPPSRRGRMILRSLERTR